MVLERIDAFDINYVDSCARKEFKLKKTTGEGEKRLYIGNDEAKYDEFFDFNNVEYFFTKKNDLLEYLKDAENEFLEPTQEYCEDTTKIYSILVEDTKSIGIDTIKYKFKKTFDSQKRYYISFRIFFLF